MVVEQAGAFKARAAQVSAQTKDGIVAKRPALGCRCVSIATIPSGARVSAVVGFQNRRSKRLATRSLLFASSMRPAASTDTAFAGPSNRGRRGSAYCSPRGLLDIRPCGHRGFRVAVRRACQGVESVVRRHRTRETTSANPLDCLGTSSLKIQKTKAAGSPMSTDA